MPEFKKPFAGLRVADFAWVGVGPTVSKYLADNGAEVIRVESSTYPESLRRVGPFVEDELTVFGKESCERCDGGTNKSATFMSMFVGLRSSVAF